MIRRQVRPIVRILNEYAAGEELIIDAEFGSQSSITFVFTAREVDYGRILPVQVSLDRGRTFSGLGHDAFTVLSSASIIVHPRVQKLAVSPSLVDKTSLAEITQLTLFDSSTISEPFRPEPTYSCRIIGKRTDGSSFENDEDALMQVIEASLDRERN